MSGLWSLVWFVSLFGLASCQEDSRGGHWQFDSPHDVASGGDARRGGELSDAVVDDTSRADDGVPGRDANRSSRPDVGLRLPEPPRIDVGPVGGGGTEACRPRPQPKGECYGHRAEYFQESSYCRFERFLWDGNQMVLSEQNRVDHDGCGKVLRVVRDGDPFTVSPARRADGEPDSVLRQRYDERGQIDQMRKQSSGFPSGETTYSFRFDEDDRLVWRKRTGGGQVDHTWRLEYGYASRLMSVNSGGQQRAYRYGEGCRPIQRSIKNPEDPRPRVTHEWDYQDNGKTTVETRFNQPKRENIAIKSRKYVRSGQITELRLWKKQPASSESWEFSGKYVYRYDQRGRRVEAREYDQKEHKGEVPEEVLRLTYDCSWR